MIDTEFFPSGHTYYKSAITQAISDNDVWRFKEQVDKLFTTKNASKDFLEYTVYGCVRYSRLEMLQHLHTYGVFKNNAYGFSPACQQHRFELIDFYLNTAKIIITEKIMIELRGLKSMGMKHIDDIFIMIEKREIQNNMNLQHTNANITITHHGAHKI